MTHGQKENERWARAIITAMVQEIPEWPNKPTPEQLDAQNFYLNWLNDMGWKLGES